MTIEPNSPEHDRFNQGDLNDANLTEAQKMLKKAYLLLSFGHFDQALIACSEAAKLCPDNHVAPSLHGAILIASGRTTDAIQYLSRIIRRYPNEPLPRLYFCEACLLGGRAQRGLKELDIVGKMIDADSPWRQFYESIQATFDGLDLTLIPQPLIVPELSEGSELSEAKTLQG